MQDSAASAGHEEAAYLALVLRILTEGDHRLDRTCIGTRTLFGTTLRFDLRSGFPLLTTKHMHWRGIVEELLWFISGSTDAKRLAAKGVHIWDANGSRTALDSRGLTANEVGDLGPIYGFQWRHFGAEYRGPSGDYAGQGVDQLTECIKLLRNDPSSRRILLSAWDPRDMAKMALPPCHVLSQWSVNSQGLLSCQLYQRSADMGLGVPFNIASYALLTHLMAHVAGLQGVGEFIHVMGDCHVYDNHEQGLREQLTREPMPWPRLELQGVEGVREIDAIRAEHIVLKDYHCHPAIKLSMAV